MGIMLASDLVHMVTVQWDGRVKVCTTTVCRSSVVFLSLFRPMHLLSCYPAIYETYAFSFAITFIYIFIIMCLKDLFHFC